jgi:hypothetical protein
VFINESVCPHAVYLHEGTKDHMVYPVNKKVLHWVAGGQSGFSKGHEVSGIKGFKFLDEAAKIKETTVQQKVESDITSKMKDLGL